LALCALAWLAMPPLLKWQGETRLSALLGRPVTIAAVAVQPWSLSLTLQDVVIGTEPGAASSPAPAEPLLRLARLHVNVDISSLLRLAPVIEALELDGLQLRVARVAEGRYDIDDLIARFTPQSPAAPGDPARFALYNLVLRDASVRLDDRPVARVHLLDQLQLSLPFVSNLPAHIEVRVEPRLAFRLDGTAFDSGAQATPFAQTRSGTLKLSFSGLDLAAYRPYWPAGLPVQLQRGSLAADLALQFALPAGGAPALSLQGTTTLRDLNLAERDGAALLAWDRLQLEWRDVQPLTRQLDFGTLRLEGLQVQLSRGPDGRLNLQRLGGAPTADQPADQPADQRAHQPADAASAPLASKSGSAASQASGGVTTSPWRLRLERLDIAGARVRWNDALVRPAAALLLDEVGLQAGPLPWPLAAPVPLQIAATLRPQEDGTGAAGKLTIEGTASDRQAQLAVHLTDLSLPALAPYLAQTLVPRVEGTLSAKGRLDWSGDTSAPRAVLQLDGASLDGLRLSEPGSRGAKAAPELASLQRLAITDTQIDVQEHRAVLGTLTLAQPAISVARDAQGQWNVLQWIASAAADRREAAVKPSAPSTPFSSARPAVAGSPEAVASSPAWRVQLQAFQLDGGRLRFTDAFAPGHATAEPVRADVGGLRLRLQNLQWPGGRGIAPATVQFSARLSPGLAPGESSAAPARERNRSGVAGNAGGIEWNGRFAPDPLQASGKLRIERFPVQVFEPYFGERINLSLLRAEAGYQGDFSVQDASTGWRVQAAGDVRIADLQLFSRPEAGAVRAEGDALLNWQLLSVEGLRFAMDGSSPPQVEVREASLNDFYSRLVITEQGRFNLRDVAAAPAPAASAAPADAVTAPASTASSSSTSPASAAPAAASAPPALSIAVGGVQLRNGRIDFTDRFIRPNYSANLSELNGRLGAFRSGTRDMATLELRGRAAGTALLDIRGALNPTADPLALDIQAKATDLELAPLSPYAGKYAGYAIERGKLSMELAYRIDPDGKLEAKNQVILNQLTFGDKVESPDATKLPVLLAVALLKDRNGVIDINLPVSGSINDPQFSVFGIVLKVIGNLLVKALTAPFALLAGGGSDDLSLVEFEPGMARLKDSGRAALDKVAKALADRPALRMTVTGTADPQLEREAFQRASLEARLLAEHRRELLRAGASQAAADAAPPMDGEARAKVLRQVYRQSDLPDKPRNALGFARDIPGPEMEALLRRHTVVSDDAIRELALQRGLAVRDALIAQGLPSERLFLAAPKLRAPGEDKDSGAWTPRGILSLSTN
jgi:uncharacterized protein involved in outer membrane biogenesis